MKIVHWVSKNGSGMNQVAEDMACGERSLNIASIALDWSSPQEVKAGLDADIHVIHTHLPDEIKQRAVKTVWVIHGTPEVVLHNSLVMGQMNQHGAPDSWMAAMHLLKESDAVVTLWPRHQAIWQTLVDKGRHVYCVPMGIDPAIWKPVPSRGKYDGDPSLLFAENCHYIKWPLDLFIAFPWITEQVPGARLHVLYLPLDQHRCWFPLIDRNGAAYRSHVTSAAFPQDQLRNAFVSVDYYLNLVRYGDFNHISLEAKACGCQVISYEGNPYADFWISEGDQRRMAAQILSILNKERPPRETSLIPKIEEMSQAMVQIYGQIG